MLRFTNVDERPVRLPPVYGYRTHALLPLRQALDPLLPQTGELGEFIKIAKDECHYPSEHGLTREESASIYLYTMDWGEKSLYRVLNAALRIPDRSVLVPWHGYLKLFDTALKKLPSLHMNLWRGVNLNINKNFKENEKLTWWSFNSCSSAVKVIKQFLGPLSTLFMIEANNGKDISVYSNFPDEKEVILGLGTRLRVMSDALDHSSLNVVHLVELSDEDEEELSSSLANMAVVQSVKSSTSNATTSNKASNIKVEPYSDGSRYEGEWKDGKKHGKGTRYFADGEKYIGDWVNDQQTGQGIFTWPNGSRYEGQFQDDKKNGEGIYTWPNDDRYEGQFKDGQQNGKGTYYFADGNKYNGDWVNGQRTGQDIYTWPNGDRYEGQFKDGQQNGKGTSYFADGNKYNGDWVNGQLAGQGIYTWPSGNRYEGQFKDGKKNGKGTYYYSNGQVKEGMWSNDNFIG